MIRILWRSARCIVVFKPAGLPTQAPAPHDSLETRLRAQLGSEHAGARPPYIALPHRLDRAVSGVILVALSKRAAGLLGQQFETRKTSKTYLAWVEGQVCGDLGPWIDPLRKVPDQARAEIVCDTAVQRDQPPVQQAVTAVRVLERRPWGSLLELQPITGRMHQLRLQCAHRGHPIIGDALYGSSQKWSGDSDAVGTDRLALHAWKINFRDPHDGKAVSVEAPPCWSAERMPRQFASPTTRADT